MHQQIKQSWLPIKENVTAKTVEITGQGTVEIKVTIDGATKSYKMDMNNTTSLSIP